MGPLPDLLAIDGAMAVVVAWFAIGLAGLAALHNFALVAVLFPLSAVLSIALAGIALLALPGAPQTAVLAIGLPDLPFHLRLDALSAFFLGLLGLASAGIPVFAGGYFRRGEGTPAGLLCLHYHVFLARMAMVMLGFVMGTWRECFVIEADAETQTMHARITGTLFNAVVPFSLVQNVALKYSNGEVLQSFGAPRLSNPASLEYIPYMSVQS